jgi:hypothetical protein
MTGGLRFFKTHGILNPFSRSCFVLSTKRDYYRVCGLLLTQYLFDTLKIS